MIGALIKTALVASAGIGGGMITGNAVRSVTPITAGKLTRVFSTIGAFGLGGAVGTVAANTMRSQIAEVESWFKVPPLDKKK